MKMKHVREVILAILFTIVFVCLVDFIAINWMLGCQSWDRELWTPQHSCLTPYDIWKGLNK